MPSKVSLFIATPEQTIISRKRTYVEWGRGLTLEQYLERDELGECEEFAKDGKLTTWVLAPQDNPTTTGFFCSCETFKRQIAIAHPSTPENPKSTLTLGQGYGIASVFTPAQNRGHGYAKQMMKLLHRRLAPSSYLLTKQLPRTLGPIEKIKEAGDASCSALWSDVGPTFYASLPAGEDENKEEKGWVIESPYSTIWKLDQVDFESVEEFIKGREIAWMNIAASEEIWNKDAESIKQELIESAEKENKIQFSFLPNKGVAAFQWFRLYYHFSRYIADYPKYCGLRIVIPGTSEEDEGPGSFATWTCEYRPGTPKTLTITRIRADKNNFVLIIANILKFAKRHGMEEVEVWNLGEELEQSVLDTALRGRRFERDEHLPSVKWYGEEEVSWKNNEKVLAPEDNPTTADFLCSCRTYKRQIAIAYPPTPENPKSTLTLGQGYGVSAVFTPPYNRGYGYAKRMMKLLHWRLAPSSYLSTKHLFPLEKMEGFGDAYCSVLYSDVGPDFYASVPVGEGNPEEKGWVVESPYSTIWKLNQVDFEVVKEVTNKNHQDDEIIWMDLPASEEIWMKDVELIKQELIKSAEKENKTQFSFLPDKGVAAFQWFRLQYHFSRYIADYPRNCGMRVVAPMAGIPEEGPGSFATWDCEFRSGFSKTVTITRIRADKNTFAPIIANILKFAKQYGKSKCGTSMRNWNRAFRIPDCVVNG